MSVKNTGSRYGGPTIAMHWLMLILIAAAYAAIELKDFWPKGSAMRDSLKTTHFSIGLTILALVVARIALRMAAGPRPVITPQPSAWQEKLAGLMHVALYVFMIAMPVAGWVILSAEGKPIALFGLSLPALVGQSKPLAKSVEEIHEFVGNAGYFLIGLHALAALAHHYGLRDNTLRRMLPGRA